MSLHFHGNHSGASPSNSLIFTTANLSSFLPFWKALSTQRQGHEIKFSACHSTMSNLPMLFPTENIQAPPSPAPPTLHESLHSPLHLLPRCPTYLQTAQVNPQVRTHCWASSPPDTLCWPPPHLQHQFTCHLLQEVSPGHTQSHHITSFCCINFKHVSSK